LHISWSKVANLILAALIVVPKLNTRVVEKRDEEAIDRWRPLKSSAGQTQFFDYQRMQQTGEVGAWRHAHARKGLLYGAGPAYSVAALKYEHALACSRKIGRAGEPIVACSHDESIPSERGEFMHRRG
jgi:hypothetical protein